MDDCDYASRSEAIYTAAFMATRKASSPRPDVPSAYYCVRCDEPIPEARRSAQPGCQLCVDCQAREESP